MKRLIIALSLATPALSYAAGPSMPAGAAAAMPAPTSALQLAMILGFASLLPAIVALFMTAFVMAPVAAQVNERAITPYFAGQLDEAKAIDAATPPLRTFLLRHTRQRDLGLFLEIAGKGRPQSADEVPLRVCVPAFAISELRTAFEMGLIVLLPLLVIDIAVATTLSSLGMMMLPPSVVSLPAKLLVFLAADGWHLLVESLLRGMA